MKKFLIFLYLLAAFCDAPCAQAAIAIVGTASGTSIDGADVTVTLPSYQVGDVVYATYCENDGLGDYNMATITSGYTELADLNGNDDYDANMGLYRKVMADTTDTTVVMDGHGNASAGISAVVIVLRGENTTTPEDATTTTATGINGGDADPPSINTATANAWVLAFGCSTEPSAPPGFPAGYSNTVSTFGNDTAFTTSEGATKLIASPGAENPAAFTDTDDDASDAWAAATVAVKAATAPPADNRRRMPGGGM